MWENKFYFIFQGTPGNFDSILKESLSEEDIGRQSRSLLSRERPIIPELNHSKESFCECKTNHKSSYGLKVNYFPNGFNSIDDYRQADERRR